MLRPLPLQRHVVALSLAALGVLTVAVLPVADSHIRASALAGSISIVVLVALDLLVGAMLVRRHLRTGAERPLGLGLAYLLAGGLAAAQALRHGNDAGWAWVGWHVAFPSCFALSMALATAPAHRRTLRAVAYIAGALAAAGGFVALTTLFPQVLRPGSSVNLKLLAGAEVLAVNLVAMLAVTLRARRRTPLERWLIVAAAAASTDVVLTLGAGGATGALGWWAGRALCVLAAVVALRALRHEARVPVPRALVLLVFDQDPGEQESLAAAARLRAALRGDDRLERQPEGAYALVLRGVDGEGARALARLGAALCGEDYALRVRGAWTALELGEDLGPAALARAHDELRQLSRPPAHAAGEPALGAA